MNPDHQPLDKNPTAGKTMEDPRKFILTLTLSMASLQSAALKELKRKSLIQDSNSVSYDNSCPILEIEEPQPYAETLESPQ